MTPKIDPKNFGNINQNAQSDELSQAILQADPRVNAAVGLDRDTHGTNFAHSHAPFVGSEVKYGHIHYSLPTGTE